MKRLYYGVASIVIDGHQYNEFGHGLFDSEEEAIGRLVKTAKKFRPGGQLSNVAAYPVDDASIVDAAHHLAVAKEQAEAAG